MSWDMRRGLRREFKTSISNQLNFQTKLQEFKNLGQSSIVGLTKTYGFCVQRIAFVINQSKGILRNYMWQYHQHTVQKYLHHIFQHPLKYLKLDSHLQKICFICFTENPLKILQKTFQFHLKSSFCSEDNQTFILTFWLYSKNGLIKKKRLV